MIKICYIYKNERTMFRVLNRIECNLGRCHNRVINGGETILNYENVSFHFLKYPTKNSCIRNTYIKIYIENVLKKQLNDEQLNNIYSNNTCEFLTDGFCEII